MATERPILNALKEAFAAMIPILLQWFLKLAIPTTPAVKVAATRTKKASDATNDSSGGSTLEA